MRRPAMTLNSLDDLLSSHIDSHTYTQVRAVNFNIVISVVIGAADLFRGTLCYDIILYLKSNN